MNKKDKNKTILTIISTSAARKPNLKLPIPTLQAQLISTFPHRHRTQSERTADATRSDGGRNLIGRRTEHDDFYGAFSTRKPHSLLTLAKHVRNQT